MRLDRRIPTLPDSQHILAQSSPLGYDSNTVPFVEPVGIWKFFHERTLAIVSNACQ